MRNAIRRLERLAAARRGPDGACRIVIVRGGQPVRAVAVTPGRGPFDRTRSRYADALAGESLASLLARLDGAPR